MSPEIGNRNNEHESLDERIELEANSEVHRFSDEILVRVTPAGEAIWDKRQDDIARQFVDKSQFTPRKIERDEQGYTKMQLFQVANIFGEAMCNGNNNLPVEVQFKIPTEKTGDTVLKNAETETQNSVEQK